MYTGGVSSLAGQIANQLQSQEDPKPLPEKRDLVSMLSPRGRRHVGAQKKKKPSLDRVPFPCISHTVQFSVTV